MILYGLLTMIGLAVLVALADWRRGIFCFIAVGLLQDPLRKMIPGAPSYLVLATVPVWGAILFHVVSRTGGGWEDLRRHYPTLGKAAHYFAISLLPAAVLSATYGPGSWQITLVGAYSYGSLLIGLLLGYLYPVNDRDLPAILGFYVIGASVLLIGTPLDYYQLFPEWAVLGTKSMGFEWLRYIPGVTVKMFAGFFRSPDIMGWHAATVTMFSLVLALRSRGNQRLLWLGLAVWGTTGLVLCGRRKMIMMLPPFVMALTWISWLVRKQFSTRGLALVLILSLAGSIASYSLLNPDDTFMIYYTNDPGDVLHRLEVHGASAVLETFAQSGPWGTGLGTASTGVQHLNVGRPRTWQEGGLSRVAVELGIPGLLCFAFLVWAVIRSAWDLLFLGLDPQSPLFSVYAGLSALFAANALSFVVSGQIYGDPFIMTFLAFLLGLTLSGARLQLAPAEGDGHPLALVPGPLPHLATQRNQHTR